MKIGLVLPLTETPGAPAPRYPEIRERALLAERLGFDSVWVYDHLLFRFPEMPTFGSWESWTVLSALAEATSRVELGALVMCTAFRNPGVLAKMADALDEVSGGRLILGLGAGWHQPEFDAFGLPFDRLASRFEEALEIVVPLLRTGQVDFRGQYVAAPDCVSRPRGPREQGPPILIGAFGPRTMRLTARHADAWNSCWHGRPDKFVEEREKFLAACAEEGRDPATVEITAGISVAFPDLGPIELPGADDPAKTLSGSAEDIAAALREWAALGVGHVQLSVQPDLPAAVERLGEAIALMRHNSR